MPFAIIFIVLFIASMARSEEHQHGVNGLPDWYDTACCDRRDCRPVDGKDEPEAIMYGTEPAYRWHGLVFEKPKFKRSQDERFHVCITSTMMPMCIYLPAMT